MPKRLAVGLLFASTVLLLVGQLPAEQPEGQPDPLNVWLTVAARRESFFEIVAVNLRTEQRRSLVADATPCLEPCWSPDGKRLAFVCFRTGAGQIFVMDVDTGSIVNVTKTRGYERNPAWSPDGQRIAFTSQRAGNQDIFVMDADGSNVTNLTQNPGFDADPVWSPDGKQICFTSMRDDQPFRLFVMQADGSEQQALSDEALAGWVYPDWSPDGKKIALGKRDGNNIQLQIFDLEDKTFHQITEGPGTHTFARWSPDGSLLAYAYFANPPPPFHPDREIDAQQAGGDLILYDVATGEQAQAVVQLLPQWGPRATWQKAEAIKAAVIPDADAPRP